MNVGDLPPDKTVYNTGSRGGQRVHTRANCSALRSAKTIIEKPARAHWNSTEVCTHCEKNDRNQKTRIGGLPFGVE